MDCQVTRSFANRACLGRAGKAIAAVPRYRRINCADAKTMAGSSTGGHKTATAGSDVVQSGRPIFDDFFQHLWSYIGNNTANVVFQMVKRLWLIRIDQRRFIAPQKIV
ncbi:hypothetical protein TNCV_1980431 [Trichonephila clavipes]|nr:hypothetical protein TNCV_1980431 [Trichonephila clavipes]